MDVWFPLNNPINPCSVLDKICWYTATTNIKITEIIPFTEKTNVKNWTFLVSMDVWVLTQIYSKTRVYWNCLSQSIWKFLQRQPIPTHYLPEMLRLILKEPSRTYFTSCHPPNVKKGFVKGEALRILQKKLFRNNLWGK